MPLLIYILFASPRVWTAFIELPLGSNKALKVDQLGGTLEQSGTPKYSNNDVFHATNTNKNVYLDCFVFLAQVLLLVLGMNTLNKIDIKESNKLVTDNMAFATKLANLVRKRTGCQSLADDMQSFAFEGLVKAARRFDASRNVKFTTFSYKIIMGAIIDGMAEIAPLKRGIASGLSKDEQAALLNMGSMEMEEPSVPSDRACIENEVKNVILKAISSLPENKKKLIEERYFADKNLEDTAKDLGKSTSWASRTHARTLVDLKKKILRMEPELVA